MEGEKRSEREREGVGVSGRVVVVVVVGKMREGKEGRK